MESFKISKSVSDSERLDETLELPVLGPNTWAQFKPGFPVPVVTRFDHSLLLAERAGIAESPRAAAAWLRYALELLGPRARQVDRQAANGTKDQLALDSLLDIQALLAHEAKRLAQPSAAPAAPLPGILWSSQQNYWQLLASAEERKLLQARLDQELREVSLHCTPARNAQARDITSQQRSSNGAPAPPERLKRIAGMLGLVGLSLHEPNNRLRQDRLLLRKLAEDSPARLCLQTRALVPRIERYSRLLEQ